MRKVMLYMTSSFDGYVSSPDNKSDWFDTDDPESWKHLFELTKDIDAAILGGGMWEEYRDYWTEAAKGGPDHSANATEYARWAMTIPHYVFSHSGLEAKWEKAKIVSEDAVAFVTDLKKQSGKNIYLIGGADFAASIIDAGLIDEYRIQFAPVILGGGKSFFHELKQRRNLKLQSVKEFKDGMVEMCYMPG